MNTARSVPQNPKPLPLDRLTKAQFDAELEKGYADFRLGKVRPAEEVFADIRKDFGI